MMLREQHTSGLCTGATSVPVPESHAVRLRSEHQLIESITLSCSGWMHGRAKCSCIRAVLCCAVYVRAVFSIARMHAVIDCQSVKLSDCSRNHGVTVTYVYIVLCFLASGTSITWCIHRRGQSSLVLSCIMRLAGPASAAPTGKAAQSGPNHDRFHLIRARDTEASLAGSLT